MFGQNQYLKPVSVLSVDESKNQDLHQLFGLQDAKVRHKDNSPNYLNGNGLIVTGAKKVTAEALTDDEKKSDVALALTDDEKKSDVAFYRVCHPTTRAIDFRFGWPNPNRCVMVVDGVDEGELRGALNEVPIHVMYVPCLVNDSILQLANTILIAKGVIKELSAIVLSYAVFEDEDARIWNRNALITLAYRITNKPNWNKVLAAKLKRYAEIKGNNQGAKGAELRQLIALSEVAGRFYDDTNSAQQAYDNLREKINDVVVKNIFYTRVPAFFGGNNDSHNYLVELATYLTPAPKPVPAPAPSIGSGGAW